jgi:hypothetical protein
MLFGNVSFVIECIINYGNKMDIWKKNSMDSSFVHSYIVRVYGV